MITLMVSSVAIGVGVDDAIHFMLQYIKQRKGRNTMFGWLWSQPCG